MRPNRFLCLLLPFTGLALARVTASTSSHAAKSSVVLTPQLPSLQPTESHNAARDNVQRQVVSPNCSYPPSQTGKIQSMYSLNKNYERSMYRALAAPGQQCARNPNYGIRRSWRWSGSEQREAYLQAVRCLHGTTPNVLRDAPGSRFRIDDFVAIHMLQGYRVEFTGLHLHWHRIFLHLYEQALRNECGYVGSLMYWDFSDFSNQITADPIFASFGGDGKSAFGNGGPVSVDYFGRTLLAPSGAGGGCLAMSNSTLGELRIRLGRPVTSGPNTTQATTYPLPRYENGRLNGDYLRFRDRCLTRQLNVETGQLLNHCHVEYDLDCSSFDCLQQRLYTAGPEHPYQHNIMNAARFAMGGLQLDPFAGPGDPMWWLVAVNLDRLWALWQGQEDNLEARKGDLAGTHSPYNNADSPEVGMGDLLDFGGLANNGSYRVADATSSIEGPLCYLYAGTE